MHHQIKTHHITMTGPEKLIDCYCQLFYSVSVARSLRKAFHSSRNEHMANPSIVFAETFFFQPRKRSCNTEQDNFLFITLISTLFFSSLWLCCFHMSTKPHTRDQWWLQQITYRSLVHSLAHIGACSALQYHTKVHSNVDKCAPAKCIGIKISFGFLRNH